VATREKKTEATDVKLTYQASDRDSLSYRFSFQRPVVFDPASYGVYGGPANDGFAGTGTNKTFSTALNWTRTLGATAILETRAGLTYYHNVATAQGAGLNTSTDVGIQGVNLDDFTSGLTTIQIQNGLSEPLLGFANSLPWDRSEKMYSLASTFTKIKGNHTVKVGFDVRHNRDFLLQVQDNGGPGAGSASTQPRPPPLGSGLPERLCQRLGQLPARLALARLPRPQGHEPGVRHWAIFTFIHDKWQVTPKLTLDLGLRHEYYTPFTGLVTRGGCRTSTP